MRTLIHVFVPSLAKVGEGDVTRTTRPISKNRLALRAFSMPLGEATEAIPPKIRVFMVNLSSEFFIGHPFAIRRPNRSSFRGNALEKTDSLIGLIYWLEAYSF